MSRPPDTRGASRKHARRGAYRSQAASIEVSFFGSVIAQRSHVMSSPPVHRSTRSSTPARSCLERHELHRALDGDWPPTPPSAAERREALIMGLAAVATLPVVSLVLQRWPEASAELAGAIGLIPLVGLVVVALTWRSVGGEP